MSVAGDGADRGRDPFSSYLDRMASVGFRPSSSRGQNFLLDQTLHRWIAEQAAPGPADGVVEIGVGLGFLTRELQTRAGAVLAVEIEPRLLEISRQDLADAPNVEWRLADALGGPGRSIDERIVSFAAERAADTRLLVVANLPYSVSGPLLAELYQLDRLPDRIVVLVQKELGQRLAAEVGQDGYGGLSALLQSGYRARLLRDVAASAFRPRPKVVSAVVQLDRHQELPASLATAAARRRFARFVRELFGQRRKVLRSNYERAVKALGVAPQPLGELASRRAEQLSGARLLELFEALPSPT